jgi:predicted transcriptional regulator
MRVHITLDEDVVGEIDEIAGPRGRSAFIERAVAERLERETRWRRIESSLGSIPDTGHAWDEDPAAWVREQRRRGERRLPI